ncbi:MAG TPA: DUF2142 domain-containing protein [Anaerolineae bacterium]|nr:DUF2142 domain-containing protein [Anaerolineae bacterium]
MPFRTVLKRRLPMAVLLLSLSLVRGFSYSVIIPPWQAPDEPGHVEYAVLLAEKRRFLNREDSSSELQQQILLSMKEFDFWRHLGREEPQTMSQSFSQDPSLALSGTQLGDESPLYYLIPALVFILAGTSDTLLHLYVLRWFSVVLSSATVVVSYLVAVELFPEDRFMRTAVPAFVMFLPMFAYMGCAANSDAAAILLSSLFFWQLVMLFKNGANWRSVFALTGVACLSIVAKKTALFAAPLILVAVPVYLWGRRTRVEEPIRRAVAGSVLLFTLFLGIFLGWAGGDAAGWVEQPPSSMNTRSDHTARSGSYSLHIGDDTDDSCQWLVQSLPYNSVRELRGRTAELSAWVRSPNADQTGRLAITDNEGRATQVFTATNTWSLQSVTRTISPEATSIRLVLGPSGCSGAETGELFFDDVFLGESQGQGRNLVANGSGETPDLSVWDRLEHIAPHLSLSRLFDGRSYDTDSVKRYSLYALLTFAGFWANFGWLTLPLDPVWYGMLALLCLALGVGLGLYCADALTLWKRRRDSLPTWQNKSLFLLLVALCLMLFQTFLPMIGRDWQPQGRYLFPAIIPIATLLSLGWRRIHRRWGSNIGLIAWVTLLFLLHVLCVFGYIIPHYYG